MPVASLGWHRFAGCLADGTHTAPPRQHGRVLRCTHVMRSANRTYAAGDRAARALARLVAPRRRRLPGAFAERDPGRRAPPVSLWFCWCAHERSAQA